MGSWGTGFASDGVGVASWGWRAETVNACLS